jgi:hypothetical protein
MGRAISAIPYLELLSSGNCLVGDGGALFSQGGLAYNELLLEFRQGVAAQLEFRNTIEARLKAVYHIVVSIA